MTEHFTLRSAQRIAVAAQGFQRRTRRPTKAAAIASLAHTGVWQIDSINVFARSHTMPWFSRNGAYDLELFNDVAWGKRSTMAEYVAHEATLLSRSWLPRFGWRMDDMRARYTGPNTWLPTKVSLQQRLLDELRDRGPLTAAELEQDTHVKSSPWWGWSDVKRALELMFRTGDVTSIERRGFRRVYALPSQVLTTAERTYLPREAAQYELVKHAASALGIATTQDIADYFRMPIPPTIAALRRLQEEGSIERATVEGWTAPTWLATGAARTPRSLRNALVSPFDPLVWYRPRLKRLFNVDYRIEIYTPAPKRQYGYYTLPVLIDGRIVGRLDLKADRAHGKLLVASAWAEPGTEPETIASSIYALLIEAAEWQSLTAIEIMPVGNLATALIAAAG